MSKTLREEDNQVANDLAKFGSSDGVPFKVWYECPASLNLKLFADSIGFLFMLFGLFFFIVSKKILANVVDKETNLN